MVGHQGILLCWNASSSGFCVLDASLDCQIRDQLSRQSHRCCSERRGHASCFGYNWLNTASGKISISQLTLCYSLDVFQRESQVCSLSWSFSGHELATWVHFESKEEALTATHWILNDQHKANTEYNDTWTGPYHITKPTVPPWRYTKPSFVLLLANT